MIPEKLNNTIELLKGMNWIINLSNFANIYIVGGSVRDAYLGNNVKDIDLIVDKLTLDDIKDILEHYGKVNIVGESFSVLKFRPIGWVGEDFDIAVPRQDRKIGNTHKDFEIVTKGVTVLDDLKRRDFTINSVAVNVMTKEILDPFKGLLDLKSRTIRATDINAFSEDPLRILRAMMFASRFNFNITSSTKALMSIYSKELKTISPERILEEFMKILNKGGNLKTMINIMYETDIDLVLFGNKMKKELHHEKLDVLSFFYMLAKLGNVNPLTFYKVQLKGEYLISEGISCLHDLMNVNIKDIDEETLRYFIFTRIKKSPLILDVKIFPQKISEIIDTMKDGDMPMKASDIKANGDDAIDLDPSLENTPLMGQILKRLQIDALMGYFRWYDRKESLMQLNDIIRKFKK